MKSARRVREGKFFRLADLLIYGMVLVLAALLFFFVTFRASDEPDGFRVEVSGEMIYSYEFGRGGEIAPAWADRITESATDGAIVIGIRISSDAWNELIVDDASRTVSMRDANCSRRKDCCTMLPLGAGVGAIVCIPHGLRILPLSGEDLSSPSVG